MVALIHFVNMQRHLVGSFSQEANRAASVSFLCFIFRKSITETKLLIKQKITEG